MAVLALSVVSSIAMWLFFFVALIFYEEGDDKRTLLLSSCVVLDLLAVFSLLIPTYSIVEMPAYNVIANTISSSNSITITSYPAYNETIVNPPYSNPVITLYTVFAVFQGFIFLMFAIWSLKSRLQYKTYKQYKAEMEKNRM